MCEEGQCCKDLPSFGQQWSNQSESVEDRLYNEAIYCSRCGEKLLPETKMTSNVLKYDRIYGFPYYYWTKKCPNHKSRENIAHDIHYQIRADKSKGPF